MRTGRNYVFNETLKDGTHVVIRAVRQDDGPRIQRAFAGLEPETMYTRFFSHKRHIADQELKRVTEADFLHNVALVATVGSGDEEIVIGGASYSASPTESPPRIAEIAFTVEEDFRNRGMAGLLLRHLIGIAQQNNLSRLTAEVLATNAPMLTVLRRSGLKTEISRDGDINHVSLILPEQGMERHTASQAR